MSKWLDNAIFYEIYPQSFCDSNADGIGDLQGIIRKLDYIQQLGFNAIWINPIYESPFRDAGYDVTNYYKVAPRYGTNEDLKQLIDAIHERGMHIILDIVPGHTSSDHPWFIESMKATQNKYTDRYVWTNGTWVIPEGGSIRGMSDRDGCALVNFFTHQPALNYGYYNITEPWQQPMDAPGPQSTVEELKNIMRFYLKMGCDGFRVDMAGSLVKNDPDSKGTIALWQDMREFLDQEFPNAAMVSEWGDPAKSIEGGFHMDFLLHFGPTHYMDLFRTDTPYFSSKCNGDISQFVKKYEENYHSGTKKGLMCIPSGNHDMDRIQRKLDDHDTRMAMAFLLSMPGAPFIYAGDEYGLRWVPGLVSKEGGYARTNSRTPMQWDHTVNDGFSTAPVEDLYLPQDPSDDRPTALDAMNDPDSLYYEVKKLIALRLATPAIQSNGDIKFICVKDHGYPFAYIRDDKVVCIFNPSTSEASFECEYSLENCIYKLGEDITVNNKEVTIPARSAVFYTVK